jgi:hypothetical protein
MQSNDINHKIQKYTYKVKNARSSRDADLYRMKLQEYHRMNKNIRGGADPSDDVNEMIKQSQNTLSELNAKGIAAVYEKQKVDDALTGLQTKISAKAQDYSQMSADKTALCENTSYLTKEISKLNPGCKTDEFNATDTEKLLSEQSFIKSVCGAPKGEKHVDVKVEEIKEVMPVEVKPEVKPEAKVAEILPTEEHK